MNNRLITLVVLGASAAFGWFLSASYVERESFKHENLTVEPPITFEIPTSSSESVRPNPVPETVSPAPVAPIIPNHSPELPPEPNKPVSRESGGCYVGGCSSQLCSDSAEMMSTCEWREGYACFATASCGRQTDGTCGWIETDDLKQCLASPSNSEFDGELIQSM